MDRNTLISKLEEILDCLKYMSTLSIKEGKDNEVTCNGCISDLKDIVGELSEE